MKNPLLDNWNTPFNAPPFNIIETSHYLPAAKKAIKMATSEIMSISDNTDLPGFENTIAALDDAGEILGRISSVLFNLNSAETTKELQAAARDVSPLLARFSNDITLNDNLFGRIKEVYVKKDGSGLTAEQKMLTEKKYRNFILGGAGLKIEERKRFREISEELSTLSLKFEENVLEETNSFELHITDKSELSGLPENLVEQAESEAKGRKHGRLGIHTPLSKLCPFHAIF